MTIFELKRIKGIYKIELYFAIEIWILCLDKFKEKLENLLTKYITLNVKNLNKYKN